MMLPRLNAHRIPGQVPTGFTAELLLEPSIFKVLGEKLCT